MDDCDEKEVLSFGVLSFVLVFRFFFVWVLVLWCGRWSLVVGPRRGSFGRSFVRSFFCCSYDCDTVTVTVCSLFFVVAVVVRRCCGWSLQCHKVLK